MFEQREVIARNSHQQRVAFAGDRLADRGRVVQRLDITRKAAFGFNLQKAGQVRLRYIGNFSVRDQRPLERHSHRAVPLAHTRGVEMIADLASDQFRIRRQRIE